ncbi:MAG TPA: hypothetical protein PKO41_07670 [Dokdonella sp.]|uniref:hypothetical protein n=1 Tax=Dokdonella sp. TaxID=2291710 RepID=UPI0025C291E6|nr:hypothetical protein [Dokdonella sp.]MBX3691411.1 hypothetical protein [Dokdonella sp.]MCW5567864.1 hypothetical protein [Dokdonella sp.]HNR92287.1 hypothetical protein [Dokdonella sp.]
MIAKPVCPLLRALVLVGAVLVVAFATPAYAKSRDKLLTETLRAYAATIRWGSIEQAESFVNPAWRAEHPLSTLELERYKQVRFTAYNERPAIPVSDFEVRQSVEIAVVNLHTQEMRTIIDNQVWKFDKKAKAWTLHSGLPDLSRRN